MSLDIVNMITVENKNSIYNTRIKSFGYYLCNLGLYYKIYMVVLKHVCDYI